MQSDPKFNGNTSVIKIQFKKLNALWIVIGCIAMTLAGISVLLTMQIVYMKYRGVETILFFGIGGLMYMTLVFWPRPALEITPDAIINRTTWYSRGKYYFEKIKDCILYTQIITDSQDGTTYIYDWLGIRLKNEQEYTQKLNWIRQFLFRENKKFAHFSVNIDLTILKIGKEDLVKIFEDRGLKVVQGGELVSDLSYAKITPMGIDYGITEDTVLRDKQAINLKKDQNAKYVQTNCDYSNRFDFNCWRLSDLFNNIQWPNYFFPEARLSEE